MIVRLVPADMGSDRNGTEGAPTRAEGRST